MKTCGYCGREYDDKEPQCPQCNSTLLKYTKGTGTAKDDYNRIKNEIEHKRKNKNKILLVCALSILLFIIVMISIIIGFVNDPQRAIAKESKNLLKQSEQMLNTGEYESALNLLDQINTEWEDYNNTTALRETAERGILLEEIAEYKNSGKYEELIQYIDENVSNLNSDAEILAIYKEAAQKSKENMLTKIAEYTDSADYLGAIQYIDRLGSSMKKDSDIKSAYDSALANYETNVLDEAEAHAQAGDYTSARSVLSVAENYIGQVNALEEKLAEIDERELTTQVLGYIETENYADAIILLNEKESIVSDSPDLQTKLNTYTEKYRENVINKAAELYKTDGYEAASSSLDSALAILTLDSELLSKKSYYESLAPVALVDTVCLYNTNKKETNLTLEDKLGNTYYNAIQYRGGAYDISDDAYSRRDIYVLAKEYTRFKTVIFVPKERSPYWDNEISPSDQQRGAFTLCIYGDEELLYQSPLMISTQYPIEVEIDVTNVEQLSFSWNTFADVSSEIGMGEAYLYKD